MPDFRMFDQTMKEAQMSPDFKPEKQRIDMVLIHQRDDKSDQASKEIRKCFEDKLRRRYNFVIKKETIGDLDYKLLHCPFRSLCEMAQFVNLEIPLDEPPDEKSKNGDDDSCFAKLSKFFFDDETEDDYTCLFDMDRLVLYKNYNNPTKFFRPATRSFLVHKILINTDISKDLKEYGVFDSLEEEDNCCSCGRAKTLRELRQAESDQELQKINLPFLIMKKVYKESVVLHEASDVGKINDEDSADEEEEDPKELELKAEDPRAKLNRSWTKLFKFQPLWRIRNYFGEKIALYFAWSGHLITSLWLPMLFGLAIFIYGLFKSIKTRIQYEDKNQNVTSLLDTIKQSFDNEVTPYFAMVICIWGTIFLEFWKRTESRWAFLWDVTDYEVNEPDRPEFYGTATENDPVDGFKILTYPMRYQFMKYLTSVVTLLFMVLVVMASVTAVIIYRVLVTVDYCSSASPELCLITTTVVPSILNAFSIFVLGRFYDFLAVKLTDWENHRTQTKYDDSLIIKLFAFQFVNNYSSCFYIAFFRGRFDEDGIVGHGSEYRDRCEGTCMSQLSFQVLILMISKPLPKLCTDAILPFLKKKWRHRPSWCCFGGKKPEKSKREETFLEKHVKKENLGDFTLSEYTEKVIIFGFLMLFAASFPLAPLMALITTALDIRIDAWRLLWIYKRPVAHMAQDIGTWYTILTFMNFCGVVSNAFLVAFTSTWGNSFNSTEQVWIVVGFEHIALIIMFIFAYIVPDTPADVALKKRKKMRLQNRDKKYKMGEAIDKFQRTLEEEHHRDYRYVDQDWGGVPRQDPHRRVTYRTTPSATTATDIILDRPREVTYYEYQDEGYDNAAYDREYEPQEYIITSPVRKLKKRKKKRTRHNSVEDIPDHRETRVYDENFPIGSSAKVVLRDRSEIDV
uniref:Anoctamin n=1 Tax=Magallana gigas TaxID=29159 RepID=A0A8W8LCU0_MAGGI